MQSNLSHATLWHGRQLKEDGPEIAQFFEDASIEPIDRIILDGHKLTVIEANAMKQFATLSPHISTKKAVVLLHVDQLTPVIANSLLKLIEEPPSYLLIRLNAERVSAVLPTIRSRCQLEQLASSADIDDRFPLATIDTMNLTDQLTLADTLAKDEALPAIVTKWLQELETKLLQGEAVDASIALGQTLLMRLRSNVNRRVAIESWFIARYALQRNRS